MITKRDILALSFKVLGLLCLIWGIPNAVSAAMIALRSSNEQSIWLVPGLIAMPVTYFISAFLLLKCSKGIASLLVREDGPVQINVGEDWQRPLYTLCLRVVGAIALVRGIPGLIRALVQFSLYRRFVAPQVPIATWSQLVSAIVYLILGIYFIGGAKLIVRIAMKGSLRESDSDKKSAN